MILLDSKTGFLKAVLLDKGYLTDIRTAIAGSIASKEIVNTFAAEQLALQQGLLPLRMLQKKYRPNRPFNSTCLTKRIIRAVLDVYGIIVLLLQCSGGLFH